MITRAPTVVHPGYISGNWYWPIDTVAIGSGAAPGTGSVRLMPFCITKPIRIQALAVRITTAAVGGNCQAAIYAHNAATGKPTGAAIVSTGNISTASVGMVSASVAAPKTLAPGFYWMAVNTDNATAGYLTLTTSQAHMAFLIGTPSLGNVAFSSSTVDLSLSVPQTFGTWPDLTSATFTEVITTTNALVFMQAA